MGLSFRRRSGRIADGSKLIVPGQITTGVKVFPNTFQYKKGSKNENLGPGVEVVPEPETPKNLCCDILTGLPFIGQSITYNGVNISATGFGDLQIWTFPNHPDFCLPNPQSNLIQTPNTIWGGGNAIPNNSWSYTLNFSLPVNNVKLYFVGGNISPAGGCQEVYTLSVNNGTMVISECEGCCLDINGNQISVTNVNCINWDGSSAFGQGIFTITSTNDYTNLTISGQSAELCGGTTIFLCDLDVNPPSPPCLGDCGILLNTTNSLTPQSTSVLGYTILNNTISPLDQFITGPSLPPSQDIANTTKLMWLFWPGIVGAPAQIREYFITMCPFTAQFNRTINASSVNRGLCAIDSNRLLTYSHPFIKRLNIIPNTAVETNLFQIPNNRRLYGDIIYVPPSGLLGAKVIVTTQLFPQNISNPRYYISQYNYNTGLIEMEKQISPQIKRPDGLFEKNSKIYVIDYENGKLWSVGLSSPYLLSFIQTIPLTNLPDFKAGASTDPSCNTVRFQGITPIPSFPGTTAIQQNLACENWTNPSNRTMIYLNPSGLTIEYTTKLYNDPDFTDPVPNGYWVSDGEQVYQVGEDGLIIDIEVCKTTPQPEVLIDPIITQNGEYIYVGGDFYLMFIDPPPEELINPLIVGNDEYLNVGDEEYLEFVDPI